MPNLKDIISPRPQVNNPQEFQLHIPTPKNFSLTTRDNPDLLIVPQHADVLNFPLGSGTKITLTIDSDPHRFQMSSRPTPKRFHLR